MSTFTVGLRMAALTIGLAATATAASAQTSPVGTWIDHTGRGAVEIAECGDALCGHVVWLKDSKNASTCRTQILGNVRSVGSNTWDRGWILDPDNDSRYSVELKTVGADKLRVVGYMGSKLFSETMMWKRAPVDLKRCDGKETVAANTPAPSVAQPEPPAVSRPADTSPSVPRIAATPPAPQPSAQPESDATAPPRTSSVEPQQPSASEPAPEAEQPQPPARRTAGKRKTANNECRLELPYITVTIPCDAF